MVIGNLVSHDEYFPQIPSMEADVVFDFRHAAILIPYGLWGPRPKPVLLGSLKNENGYANNNVTSKI